MSQLLKTGIQARVPFIKVTTDDPIYLEDVLQSIAGSLSLEHMDVFSSTSLYNKKNAIFYTENLKLCTTDIHAKFDKQEKTLIFVNTELNTLMLDAGALVPPKEMVTSLTALYTDVDLSSTLTGLSLKNVDRVLRLTSTKFGNLLPVSIRTMRALLGTPIQGLYPIPSNLGFYDPPPDMAWWVAENKDYFLLPKINPVLRPRGIMLEGLPGVGKTVAAKYIAAQMGVPLYRLDLGTTLDKYIGNSEIRLMRILQQLEEYAPAVVLIDEVEKAFIQDADSGVVQRMLGQLLWWLSEHQAQILTVMTTNDKSKIPPELFREGRINVVMQIPQFTHSGALSFAQTYMKIIMGKNLAMKHVASFSFDKSKMYSATEVMEQVVGIIKSKGWGK